MPHKPKLAARELARRLGFLLALIAVFALLVAGMLPTSQRHHVFSEATIKAQHARRAAEDRCAGDGTDRPPVCVVD